MDVEANNYAGKVMHLFSPDNHDIVARYFNWLIPPQYHDAVTTLLQMAAENKLDMTGLVIAEQKVDTFDQTNVVTFNQRG